MIFLLQLATRNLFRQLRRTLLSMAAVVAGVWVLILGQGLIGGLEESTIRGEVDALSGHVLILPQDYPKEGIIHPVDRLFSVDPKLAGWLDQHTQAWTTRIMFSPRAVHGADAIRVRAIGFDADRDAKVFPRDTWHIDGILPKTVDDGVLVAESVGRVLQVKKGDALVLETRTPAGAINALSVPVAGVFTAGNPALDRFAVFVPMALTDQLLVPEGKVSHVAARLADRDQSEAVAAGLAPLVPPGAVVSTWQAECHDMLEVQKIRKTALDLLVIVLLVISALGIMNTILMAAYERVREIGTLRAMGMRRSNVIALFVIEGGMMGLIGGSIGAALGASMVLYWGQKGIDLSSMLAKAGGQLPLAAMLYLAYSKLVVSLALLFGVGAAVVGSVYPALVASQMQPADAVRAD